MAETIGKKAEGVIRTWLDRPYDGYCFDRIPDPIGGFLGQRNICDFTCYKYPDMWYIESKATEADRFDFNMITPTQKSGLLRKSMIDHVYGIIVVLYVTYKRAFIFNIYDILRLQSEGTKSLNIKKIDRWKIKYYEIPTIYSRKLMLDYTGDLPTTFIHEVDDPIDISQKQYLLNALTEDGKLIFKKP